MKSPKIPRRILKSRTVCNCCNYWQNGGSNNSVGTATDCGLDGPGIESRWGRDFSRPPSLLYNGNRVFPGDKVRPGRDADHSPLPVPRSRKSIAISLAILWNGVTLNFDCQNDTKHRHALCGQNVALKVDTQGVAGGICHTVGECSLG
jgi:hypothetical protein